MLFLLLSRVMKSKCSSCDVTCSWNEHRTRLGSRGGQYSRSGQLSMSHFHLNKKTQSPSANILAIKPLRVPFFWPLGKFC